MDNEKVLIKNTANLDKSLVQELNLQEERFEETQKHLTDFNRFVHHSSFKTDESLECFIDDEIRRFFKKIYWQRHSKNDLVAIIDEGVNNYSGNKFRILQIKDLVLNQIESGEIQTH